MNFLYSQYCGLLFKSLSCAALEVSWNKTFLITLFLKKTPNCFLGGYLMEQYLKLIRINCQYSPSKRKGQQKPLSSILQIAENFFLKNLLLTLLAVWNNRKLTD